MYTPKIASLADKNRKLTKNTMKTLKLDHQLAEDVRSGIKTATWRIYDDKNLTVNDEIELIDKVDPQNPSSWVHIDDAVIDTIVEKRLGDVVESDFDGHEKFTTQEEMLDMYRKYYGPQVALDTPVKLIHFTLLSKSNSKTTTKNQSESKITEVKLYADGGSRGNPGPSASGYALLSQDGETVVEKGIYLGVTTNNQAEYQALKLGLEDALQRGVAVVHVYMDSLLVINQMLGIFHVKNRDLWPIHDAIKQLVPRFRHVSFTHVPRALNKQADAAVNRALDDHAHQSHP